MIRLAARTMRRLRRRYRFKQYMLARVKYARSVRDSERLGVKIVEWWEDRREDVARENGWSLGFADYAMRLGLAIWAVALLAMVAFVWIGIRTGKPPLFLLVPAVFIAAAIAYERMSK